MTTTITPMIAGNWKMHGLAASIDEARALARALQEQPTHARVVLCPPATLIDRMAQALQGSVVEIGAQDCHAEACGAFTGDVCAEMLVDAGARLVIVGHSERRGAYREDDALVASKVRAALRAGLEPIVCVGESFEERDSGQAIEVVSRQVAESLPQELAGHRFSVAYEPIWAIGSGRTPTIPEVEAVHSAIRTVLVDRFGEQGADKPILYGGSVRPSNAAEFLAASDVGGALVGGASLKAEDFIAIVRAA